jgi:hypothetical protein
MKIVDWIQDAHNALDTGNVDGFVDLMDQHYDTFSPISAEHATAFSTLLDHLVNGLEDGAYEGQEDQPLYYVWILHTRLLDAGLPLPNSLDAARLVALADLSAEVGDDGDAPTYGWACVLLAFPDSDEILDRMLVIGAEGGGYFHENAFLKPAERTLDSERKALLVALHVLSGYTQLVGYHGADKALSDTLAGLKYLRPKAPNLAPVHFDKAEARIRNTGYPWNYLRVADRTALLQALTE